MKRSLALASLGVLLMASTTLSLSLPQDNILRWTPLEKPMENQQPKPDNESKVNAYGPFSQAVEKCSKCTIANCQPPRCRCSGTDIPGNLDVSATPQMVLFSFQTAVNVQVFDLYNQLFRGKRNPNGCQRTGTFFVSHNWTDYWQVQSLYGDRHEIGDNTVTSPSPPFPEPQIQTWYNQLASQKYILNKWANIPMYEIQGMRAPGLAIGGDAQLDAMWHAGLSYDTSRTTVQYIKSPHLLWPYTYDYESVQDCVVGPCPENSHPGLWEVPMVTWPDKEGHAWAVPAAVTDVTTEDEAFALLKNKFLVHYRSSNRAPLPIVLDAMWTVTDFKFKATLRFMDFLDSFRDVYVVSNWQALQWVKNPTPLCSLGNFGPFSCSGPAPKVCTKDEAITCQFGADRKLISRGQPETPVYNLHACVTTCPPCYPTVNDPYGRHCGCC